MTQTKWQLDDMLDASFTYLQQKVAGASICGTLPTTLAQATADYAYGTIACGSANISITNGDTNGRKAVMAALSGGTVTASGSAICVSLWGTALLYVTTCTGQQVTSGNTFNIGTWDIEIADVTGYA